MKITPSIDRVLKLNSKAIALAVRNEMEDFHVANLTDTQMKELNPLIRNAIYSFMKAHLKQEKWLPLHYKMIPDYWEEPVDIYAKQKKELAAQRKIK